jgi:3-dehydroquinate synthetase
MGLDADLAPWLRDDVMAYVGVDKKRAGAKVRFVALEAIGKARLVELAPEEIAQILRRNP